MKKFTAKNIFFLALPLIALISCAAPRDLIIEQQEIVVTLVPELHQINGESTFTLTAGAGRMTAMLSPGAAIEQVLVAGRDAPFSFARGKLGISLSQDGDHKTIAVTVRYRGIFNDPVPERPLNDEDPTFGVTGTITGRGVFLGSDAGWYPIPPTTPKRRITRITAPAGMEAVTSGRRENRTTSSGSSRSTWVEERPVGTLSLSAGPYQIAEARSGDTTIYTYFYPENAGLSSRYLDAAARYIRFYSGLIAPYPFEKFAVVENFFPTGYGFASYTLLGRAVIRLPFIIDTSLPHEIAHNWWGNGVLVGERGGNWSEGLVTYLADYLLKERRSIKEGREARSQFLADYAILVTPDKDFPLRDFTGRVDPVSRTIGYNKGAMLFHMMRRTIGDEAFFGALTDLCRERLYQTATWNDFGRAFSRRAGKDLLPMMEQWLDRLGGPRLILRDVKQRREKGSWQVSGVLAQEPPLYKVSLQVRLESAKGMVDQTLAVTGPQTPFSFRSSTPPRRLLLDPDVDLFRILPAAELPPTVNSIKGSKNLVAVITENCRAQRETVRLLLNSLGQGGAPLIEEREMSSNAHSGDLLFCGVPAQREVMKSPENISYSSRGFTVDAASFAGQDSLLFLVLAPPAAGRGVPALFLPLSEQAAVQYVLKISHYGRYSYVAFFGGENRLKGMLASPSAGSAVELHDEASP